MKPLRLLSVAHSYCVLLNRHLANEMARLGGNRWEVVAVAPRFMHGDLRPIPLETHGTEQCQLESVRAYFTNRIHIMYYSRRLRDLLQEPWDLVHCWEEPYLPAGGQTAWFTARNTPFVFWTAQNLSKKYPPPFSFIEKYCLHRCAGWLACGHTIVNALGPRGYDQKPFRVMPLGVDFSVFCPNQKIRRHVLQELNWDEDGPPIVGFSGRFIMDKGVHILTSALDQISTPWRALFLGGGVMEADLRKWAESYGDRVRVVTGIRHDVVPRYLNTMDLLCAPSQTTPTWHEQLGRMLTEAFACGVPVIGSDSGEIPHVISDAGIVVSESDVTDWTTAIESLLADHNRRRELSARGLDRARSEYDWTKIARRHLDFFTELVETKP